MRFAKQNAFQSYKAPSSKRLSGELPDQADKSAEQLVGPILAIAKIFGAKFLRMDGATRRVDQFLILWHQLELLLRS